MLCHAHRKHLDQLRVHEREVDQGAFDVHGIATDFLKDKPLFKSISEELLKFLNNDALVIHNAPFDLAFLNNEFLLAGIDIENLDFLYRSLPIKTRC